MSIQAGFIHVNQVLEPEHPVFGLELERVVSFREDECRIRESTAGCNFALLRKITINLLGRDCPTKTSLRGKRKKRPGMTL